jgi:hypothetical protein
MRSQPGSCAFCGDPLPVRVHGPLGTYCSARCRDRAYRARKAATAGRPATHPSLRAALVPVQPIPAAAPLPRPRPASAAVPQQTAVTGSPAPAVAPCACCGRAGKLYRFRGYTVTGHLVAEHAALCRHHQGLVWAMWQSRFGLPAMTPA